MFRLILLIAFITIPATVFAATNVNACEGIPLPKYVDIGGCINQPCDMIRGETAISKMELEIERNTTSLTPEITAKVFGLTIKYKLPAETLIGCNFLIEGDCPLNVGDVVVYQLEQPVDKLTPTAKPIVTFKLIDSNNLPVVCYSFEAQIV